MIEISQAFNLNFFLTIVGTIFTFGCFLYALKLWKIIGGGAITWLVLAFAYSFILRIIGILYYIMETPLDVNVPYFFFHILCLFGIYAMYKAVLDLKSRVKIDCVHYSPSRVSGALKPAFISLD